MKNVKLISLGLAMLICFVTKAQEKTITGTVSDASAPLPGVTIVNKNSKANASTNFDGEVYHSSAKKETNWCLVTLVINRKLKKWENKTSLM